MIETYNQIVFYFWIFFGIINAVIIGICILWDGFWTFVKGDLGEIIGAIVCCAIFAEIFLRLLKMNI